MLSHPSLTGINSGTGTSGSTAWNNSVRSRLYLSRIVQDGYEQNPDARVLRTMKSNYSGIGGEIALTVRGSPAGGGSAPVEPIVLGVAALAAALAVAPSRGTALVATPAEPLAPATSNGESDA